MAVLKIPRSKIVSVSLSVKKDSEHHEKIFTFNYSLMHYTLKIFRVVGGDPVLFKQVFLKSRPPEKLIVLSD